MPNTTACALLVLRIRLCTMLQKDLSKFHMSRMCDELQWAEITVIPRFCIRAVFENNPSNLHVSQAR